MRMLPVLMIALCGCLPSPGPSATKESVTDTSGFVVTDFDKPKAQAEPSKTESPPAPVSETSLPPESEAGVSNQTDPPSVETDLSTSAATGGESIHKPVVTCYVSPPNQYCSKCDLAKKWYSENKDKLPFTVEFTDKYPVWVDEFTTFHWKGKDEWKKIEGWYGGEHLVKAWEGTQ